jgi:hypothetical protein
MSILAMKQALEALEDAASDLCSLEDYSTAFQEETITALRQAIAEAEKREWAGLTDEEIANIANDCRWSDKYHLDFTRAIEAKLKEKNT